MMMRLDELKGAPKAQIAHTLAALEEEPAEWAHFLDQASQDPMGHVIGLTGPPGVGKSSLINALIPYFRQQDKSLAIVAVDPSSRSGRGALLGDRTRMRADPEDKGLFIRSMASRAHLGGLSDLTFPALTLLRALFDAVIVETVGVGQSETDVAQVADTVIFCVQPGSGDSLQFMKSGIMEAPDLFVVGKADMGPPARKAQADLEGALSMSPLTDPDWTPPVLLLSARLGDGMTALTMTLDQHWHYLAGGKLEARRTEQASAWQARRLDALFGEAGKGVRASSLNADKPFTSMAAIEKHYRLMPVLGD